MKAGTVAALALLHFGTGLPSPHTVMAQQDIPGKGPGVERRTAHAPMPTLLDASRVVTRFRLLGAALHNEIVLCVRGRVVGRVAVATDLTVLNLQASNTHTAVPADTCPATTVAEAHNHPMSPRDLRTHRAPALNCYLSLNDQHRARNMRYPFYVVLVDGQTWCWWSIAQVDAAWRNRSVQLMAIPGQGEGVEAGDSE